MIVNALAITVALGATTEIKAVSAGESSTRGFESPYRIVAVMPLSSLGSTDEAAQAIERVLVGELESLLGNKMVAPSEILKRGHAARAALKTCEGVVTCLVEVFGGLGWDAFVVGNIAGLGTGRVINLKLIDVRTGSEVRRASDKATGDETELIKNMRKAAVTLVAPELLVGTLELQCSQADVEVKVDGRVIGTAPLTKHRLDVPVGRHAVEANGDGLVAFSELVDIEYGEIKEISIILPDNTVFIGGETPFRSRWYTWAVGGAAILAVGLGGYFNYLQADTASRIEKRAKRGTLTADHTELFEQERDHWTRAKIFYGAGGALAIGFSTMIAFDFF